MTEPRRTLDAVDVTPPPYDRSRLGVDWAGVAKQLKANPGEWGIMADVARATASQIRLGKMSALRPVEHWEATQRTNPTTREIDLYLRYIGPTGGHVRHDSEFDAGDS